jgi:hypothetical protein
MCRGHGNTDWGLGLGFLFQQIGNRSGKGLLRLSGGRVQDSRIHGAGSKV